MIIVYKYEQGVIKRGSLDDLKTPKALIWADLFKPSKTELKEIAEKAAIQLPDLQEAVDEEERPRISDLETYSLLAFKAPLFEDGDISTTSISIFISKNRNNVITVRSGDTKSISKIKEIIEVNRGSLLFEKGLGYFVYRLLDEILNTYFTVLDSIDESIDKIEDAVIERPDKKLVNQIFIIKKTLIYFNRSLIANREVITSIEKEYVPDITKKYAKLFRNLYNDTVQLIDTVSTYRDVLTGTLDVYLSSVSNNLNQIMKVLTVGASFILIPTLIASIYGMNFKWMPELYWKYGYFFALGLMAFSIVAMYSFFKRKKWI